MFYKVSGVQKIQKIIGLELYPLIHSNSDVKTWS